MATYKVIQDIEAEDKLLGPLTLKQFIYAAVAVVCLYMCFLGLTRHAVFLLAIFLPPALMAGFFAWPWSRDQPTEIWALAKIRFFFKPRKRIWDQSGVKELVTITAPKKVETHFSSNLSPTEVKSRLRALADTIDSRGWAVKNVNVNLFSQPAAAVMADDNSDRLINVNALPQEVSGLDVQASDDILDEHSNPTAHHFDEMITASSHAHRQQIVEHLQQQAAPPSPQLGTAQTPAAPPNDYWFLNQPATPTASPAPGYVTFNSQVVAPGASDTGTTATAATPTADEAALVERLRSEHQKPEITYSHLRTIQPLSAQHAAPPMPTTPPNVAAPAVTPPPDPAILALATNNDLNVATIERQANPKPKPEPPDEVVISLH